LGRLPLYHVPRPRLVERCRDARVVVVEAGGGYGKSVLGIELADAWQAVPIDVVLLNPGVGPALFVARLRSAVERAGFGEAAAAMAAAGEDTQGAVDAAVATLAREACAFVVDDAHHADPAAARLIEHLASSVGDRQHAAVLARYLPQGCERLRRAEFCHLDASDLGLRRAELEQLCREGFRLEPGDDDLVAVESLTRGWTAAAVLAVSRAATTGQRLAALAGHAALDDTGGSPLAALLEEAISGLRDDERSLVAQVARLPFVSPALVDESTGIDGFLDRLLDVGVPLAPGGGAWWEIPGPVRDHLSSLAPPDAKVLGRAAGAYELRGELGAALQLLLGVGDDEAAASLLESAAPAVLDGLDALELQAVVAELGTAAVEAHPMVLVHLARGLNAATMMRSREEVLERAERLAAAAGDGGLTRAIEGERVKDLIRDGRFEEGAVRAATLIEETGPSEPLTKAGAYASLGRALCFGFDVDGRRDAGSLAEADGHFAKAVAIYEQLGMRSAPAVLVLYRAMWIDHALGRAHRALERLKEGLALVVDRPRIWALLLEHRAEVELELGLFDDAETSLREALAVAERYDDDTLRAYSYWNWAIAASYRGDAAATLEHLRLTEAHPGDWWDYASAEYLAGAVEALGRVGETALASEYLERAKADPQDAGSHIAMAEAVLLARAGDPELAELRLVEAPSRGVLPREYWRITLFRAFASFRRGGHDAGALAARSFEEVARLGLAPLPLTKERAVSEQLLALAVDTGQPAALALQGAALPTSLSVLGRFALTVGGRPVAVSPGQGAQLLQLLAVSNGRMVSDQVVDALWPDAGPDAARNRLRTVLNRLRAEAGDVVQREGETLTLRADVTVDLAQFELDARRALALRGDPPAAVALARSAIARYRGEVLPDIPYDEWAIRPRERARQSALRLLDLCADAAAERGDLDEMRRVVEQTIDLAPYDDDRYLRVASALVSQGRRGAAMAVLRRARTVLADLGLEPTPHLVRIESEIASASS